MRNALNAPSIDAEALKRVRPYLTLGEKLDALRRNWSKWACPAWKSYSAEK